MSQHNSARIITDGMVFAYDSQNIKSYKGPPTQNIITSRGPLNASGAGYSFVGTYEDIDVPGLGLTNCARVDIINDYSAVSTWCCPSVMLFGGGYTVSPSTTYTYGIVYKCDSGYTNANYMYRYEYNGGTYVLEQGVHTTGNRVHLGSGWYYAWGVFTTAATTNTLNGLASFYYNYPKLYDTYRVAKIMLIQGNYAGLHPKYWPNLGTTRSNTQAILDLTGNNTITANSLTYASDGSFSFNGTTDRLLVNNTAFNRTTAQEITVSCWIKPSRLAGQYNTIVNCRTDSAYNWMLYMHATDGALSFHGSGQNKTTVIPEVNKWVHVTQTVTSSGVSTLYVNGVSSAVITGYTYNLTTPGQIGIGAWGTYNGESFQGSISQVQIYNRALSASEVRQNFNALRGRYGI